jgi:hypothetical protein
MKERKLLIKKHPVMFGRNEYKGPLPHSLLSSMSKEGVGASRASYQNKDDGDGGRGT